MPTARIIGTGSIPWSYIIPVYVHTGTAGTLARAAPLRPKPSRPTIPSTSICTPRTEKGSLPSQPRVEPITTRGHCPRYAELAVSDCDCNRNCQGSTPCLSLRTKPHCIRSHLLIHEQTRDRVFLCTLDQLEDLRYSAASVIRSELHTPRYRTPSAVPHERRPRYCERGRRDRETSWPCRPSPCVP